jgi:hypothetical protein
LLEVAVAGLGGAAPCWRISHTAPLESAPNSTKEAKVVDRFMVESSSVNAGRRGVVRTTPAP